MALVPKTFSEIITFTRASTATYVDAAGVLQTAAVGTPRFDYAPTTLAPLGFLVEEARTNSIRNNTMQGAAVGVAPTYWLGWIQTFGDVSGTITSVGIESGISYIDYRIQGTYTGTTGTWRVSSFEFNNSIPTVTGQTNTASLYLSLVAGSLSGVALNIRQSIRDSGGTDLAAQDSANLSVTASPLIQQRFQLTRTESQAAAAWVQPQLRIALVNGQTYDFTIRVGMPQMEQGAFATSVIPTSTVAVTRAEDFAVINTLSPWYRQDEGTLIAEFLSLSSLTGPQSVAVNRYPRVWQIEAGTFDSAVYWYGAQAELYIGNTYNNIGSVPTNVSNKFATALSSTTGQSASSLNGAVAQARSGVLSAPATAVNIGNGGASTTVLNGYLKRIVYYPRRLTNTELQALTT